MRNRVPQPVLDRGKKETVGQKTCGGNQCPNIMQTSEQSKFKTEKILFNSTLSLRIFQKTILQKVSDPTV